MTRRHEHPLFRATALVAAACVLLLAVFAAFAASPDLHARLHGGDPAAQTVPVGDVDHACAVTLFAQGVSALLVFCLLVLARPAVAGLALRAVDEVVAAQPRYRLVPSHAPPAA